MKTCVLPPVLLALLLLLLSLPIGTTRAFAPPTVGVSQPLRSMANVQPRHCAGATFALRASPDNACAGSDDVSQAPPGILHRQVIRRLLTVSTALATVVLVHSIVAGFGIEHADAAGMSRKVRKNVHHISHFIDAKGKMDIGRIKMRLAGLQSYGTISALLMNASLRLSTSVKEPSYEGNYPLNSSFAKFNRRVFAAFTACIILSVVFGSYTTIIFTMISLYSKQALGRGLDEAFLLFYDATHVYRDSGFRSFLYSLIGFQLAFIMSQILQLGLSSLGLRKPDKAREEDPESGNPMSEETREADRVALLRNLTRRKWVMVSLAVVSASLCSFRCFEVMRLAGKHIYSAA